MSQPTVGRLVHFTLKAAPHDPDEAIANRARPAIVVRDWGNGCVNLQVFLDGSNDDDRVKASGHTIGTNGNLWLTSVQPSDAQEGEVAGYKPQDGRWHWPARV